MEYCRYSAWESSLYSGPADWSMCRLICGSRGCFVEEKLFVVYDAGDGKQRVFSRSVIAGSSSYCATAVLVTRAVPLRTNQEHY